MACARVADGTAGASGRGNVVKVFVLIPLARGDRAILEQTRRLTAGVLPEAHGWS